MGAPAAGTGGRPFFLPVTPAPELEPFKALIGDWTVEATHPAFPSVVVDGSSTFEWLEGEQFVIQRSQANHPDFPDSISVIGPVDERLAMYYFDSRGVHRVYEMSFDDGMLRIWRDAPGFSQRLEATFGEDGDSFGGVWKLSRDDKTWDDDLEITYRRAS